MQIVIARVGNEIHVAVPFEQKDRAKKVGGYRWNPTLRVWAYPNSLAIFRELIAEFGDDALVKGFEDESIGQDKPKREPTVQEQLTQKISSQEHLLQSLSSEVETLKSELAAKSNALDELERRLSSKSNELEVSRKEIESLRATTPEEQKLKQSIEFWQRAASDAEKKSETLREELAQAKRAPQTSEPSAPLRRSVTDPFVHLVEKAIAIAGNDRDFDIAVKNTTLGRAPLDLAAAVEKRLRKAIGVLSSDRRDFISVIREAAESGAISDEARGLLNFVRQNRNLVAHEQLGASELWARSCIAILATSIVWPKLQGTET